MKQLRIRGAYTRRIAACFEWKSQSIRRFAIADRVSCSGRLCVPIANTARSFTVFAYNVSVIVKERFRVQSVELSTESSAWEQDDGSQCAIGEHILLWGPLSSDYGSLDSDKKRVHSRYTPRPVHVQ